MRSRVARGQDSRQHEEQHAYISVRQEEHGRLGARIKVKRCECILVVVDLGEKRSQFAC